ncbi:MAG: hypothetical protein Q9182_000940 [Xanthomendoza sp. 2 TL-2023]
MGHDLGIDVTRIDTGFSFHLGVSTVYTDFCFVVHVKRTYNNVFEFHGGISEAHHEIQRAHKDLRFENNVPSVGIGHSKPNYTIESCAQLVAGLLYLQYHRKKQRQTHEERRRHVENLRGDYVSEARHIHSEPHELDTRVRTRPYNKPELSDEARRNVVELSPEYLRELRANRSARSSGGRAMESSPDQGWS